MKKCLMPTRAFALHTSLAVASALLCLSVIFFASSFEGGESASLIKPPGEIAPTGFHGHLIGVAALADAKMKPKQRCKCTVTEVATCRSA